MSAAATVPLSFGESLTDQERLDRVTRFADQLAKRRTVRDFAPTPVPREVIGECLRAAGSAPSGANQQPWRFVAVSDAGVKARIRMAAEAEAEERAFYEHRAPDAWLQELAPLGTGAEKPFLEVAPWLIAIFYLRFGLDADGRKHKRYYPHESVGIATGMLITALHQAGLATLTHTPSPMGFSMRCCNGRATRSRIFCWWWAMPPMAVGCRTSHVCPWMPMPDSSDRRPCAVSQGA